MFQDYSRSLFPWLTDERDIGLPLRRDRGQIVSKQAPLFGKLRSEVMDLVMGH
ncbi:hypothetical protein ACWCHM_14725 [Micromonospora sp. SCSIO 07396]